MDKDLKEYLESRPQRFCHMCGDCCRVVTSNKTHTELREGAKNGIQSAIDFLNIFEPYKSIDAAKKVSPEIVDNIIEKRKEMGFHAFAKMTFYRCKYIQDDNRCKIYSQRPAICRLVPANPWTIMPPGCGFNGWLFLKREEKKQQVRKQKEALVDLNIMLTEQKGPQKIQLVRDAIAKSEKIIAAFDEFGAQDW